MRYNKETEAIILDFLKNGYSFDRRPSHMKTAIAQGIGTNNFTLLELVPRKEVNLIPHEKVYIGEGKRDKIHHINGKLPFRKLTATAKGELEYAIKEIVLLNEKKFIDFLNKAMPLNLRVHSLELLPGIGKKHMKEIIENRPFESFEDFKKKIKSISEPEKLFAQRILSEIEGKEKINLFVKN